RARDRQRPAADPGRRAHGRPRPQLGRAGARPAGQAQPRSAEDDPDSHARPARRAAREHDRAPRQGPARPRRAEPARRPARLRSAMPPFTLVWRNLLRRPLRSVLTVLSLSIAIFLVCGLRSLITTLRAGVEYANPRRLDVLSASGLFVELPLSYQAGIEQVPGVEMTTKFQWFGGYYRSMKNFFAQFAIDPATMFDL